MSSKLIRWPPHSEEMRLLKGREEVGDCCSATLTFCSLNTAAALRDAAAPVMDWLAPGCPWAVGL
jgi:hypothetical protein